VTKFVCWHGTNKKAAKKISKDGFRPDTHFAAHLEDALAFGGPYVFEVWFDAEPHNWQFMNKDWIKPDRIKSLTYFESLCLFGKSEYRSNCDPKTW
jgi:hypothetical protein